MAQEYYSFMMNRFFETLFIQLMAIVHTGCVVVRHHRLSVNACDRERCCETGLLKAERFSKLNIDGTILAELSRSIEY